jgi:hypothetical protein
VNEESLFLTVEAVDLAQFVDRAPGLFVFRPEFLEFSLQELGCLTPVDRTVRDWLASVLCPTR